MKFKILVKDEKEQWWEDYEKNISDPKAWAAKIIDRFNRTLRPGERPRTLLDVVLKNASNDKYHDWIKRTDGMSVSFRGNSVDLYFCSKCGITGKRISLGGDIKIDSKYRKKAYRECHTAQKLIKQKQTNCHFKKGVPQ
jgi:hypothetical protein